MRHSAPFFPAHRRVMDVPEPIAIHAALNPGQPIPAADTSQAVLVRGVPTIPPRAVIGMWIVNERGAVVDFAPNFAYRMRLPSSSSRA